MPTPAYAGFSCNFTGDDSYQMDTPGTNGESMFAAVMQWDRTPAVRDAPDDSRERRPAP